MPFRKIEPFLIHVNEVFKNFYDELLSHELFSTYFTSAEQINNLLEKQKKNFIESIYDDKISFCKRFYRLGIIHYELGIPYEAFSAGSRILNKGFLAQVLKEECHPTEGCYPEVILSINEYFELSLDAMAKGYLHAFVEADKKIIEHLIAVTQMTKSGLEKELLLYHYEWLLQLINAVYHTDISLAPNLEASQSKFYEILKSINNIKTMPNHFPKLEIERIYTRIYNNAKNIFYFIQRGIYSEALSLLVNFLDIYKFTLVFSNILTMMMNLNNEDKVLEQTKRAEEDSLTGVLNRRKFDDIIPVLVEESKEKRKPLSILIIDIDDFKHVNDHFGHPMGDMILRELSMLISQSIRKGDMLIRYGGEEFVVFCLDTPLKNAIRLAERLREKVEKCLFEKVENLTISIGVAQLRGNDNKDTFFNRADHKLYEAKNHGKNRVCY